LSAGNRHSVLEAVPVRDSPKAAPAGIVACHIASADRWAGAEVQVGSLLRSLRRIEGLRLSAIFLNEGRLAAEARDCGIDVCVIPESGHNFFAIVSRAAHFLSQRNVQILHSHRYKENLLAAFLARRCRIPVHVSSRHGAPEPFSGWRGFKQDLIRSLDNAVARYATDSVISVSEDLRRQLTRNLPASKVVTIYNGLDESKVFSTFAASEAKQRLGLPPDCLIVGNAGRLDPIKRLDIFLLAARDVAAAQPDTRFLIAGSGAEESSLRSLAADLGLAERVLFLGHREDIYDVLRAMDVFVFSSDHEGLPMALLETLKLGVPVVSRRVGGIPEVIENGVTGVLVDSADPAAIAGEVLRTVRDPDFRARLSAAGMRLISAKFTSERSAAEVGRLYRSLVYPSAGSAA